MGHTFLSCLRSALHPVCVCACMFCVIAWGCRKCSCVPVCMATSVGGKQRVRVCMCVGGGGEEGGWWSAQVVVSTKRWWMMGQEGKTASQLQIDIPANVFVCCEKWCRNSHLHCPPRPSPPLVSLRASPSAVNHTLQSISNTQSFTSHSPVFWQHLITAPASWLSAHIVYLALISLLPWKPALDYCSSPLIIYPFLCLALRGTAFIENYLSGWTISCRLLVSLLGGGVEEKVKVLQGEGGWLCNWVGWCGSLVIEKYSSIQDFQMYPYKI